MKIAAGICLTTDDGRTLLVRDRASKLWGFPAGTVEDNGESPEECARREFMEEMGRTFTDPLTPCGIHTREGVMFHAFAGRCPEAFQPALGKEHTEHAWINMGVDLFPGKLYDNVIPVCIIANGPLTAADGDQMAQKPDDDTEEVEKDAWPEKFTTMEGDLEFLDDVEVDEADLEDSDPEINLEDEEEDEGDFFSEPDDDGEEEDDDEYELVDEEEKV